MIATQQQVRGRRRTDVEQSLNLAEGPALAVERGDLFDDPGIRRLVRIVQRRDYFVGADLQRCFELARQVLLDLVSFVGRCFDRCAQFNVRPSRLLPTISIVSCSTAKWLSGMLLSGSCV